jgi:hypothetical protein
VIGREIASMLDGNSDFKKVQIAVNREISPASI